MIRALVALAMLGGSAVDAHALPVKSNDRHIITTRYTLDECIDNLDYEFSGFNGRWLGVVIAQQGQPFNLIIRWHCFRLGSALDR